MSRASNELNQDREVWRLYWWAFAIRFSVGVAAVVLTRLGYALFLQDALFYEQIGRGIAADWLAGRPSSWLLMARLSDTQAWLVPFLVACFYWLVGGTGALIVLLALWTALTAWTPVVTYRITRRLGGSGRAAAIAGRIVAFSPCFAFWSGALYKEGLILLLLSLVVLNVLQLQERWRFGSVVTLVVSITALFGLRFYIAVILGAAALFGLLLGRRNHQSGGSGTATVLRQAAIALIVAIGLGLFGFADRVRQLAPDDLQEGITRIEVSRADLASSAASGYLLDARISTPADAVKFLPFGALYFIAVPLPWQVGSVRQNLVIPETAAWLLLYPVILLGMRRALRDNPQGSILIIVASVTIILLYALLVGNAGTAYRLRTQVWVLWATFAGIGWEALRSRKSQRLQHPSKQKLT